MRREILNKALQLNIEHRRRKWWHKLVQMMATVVVFTTTYALILPAITMENQTICGMTEHTHSEICSYTPVHTFGKDLQCGYETHVHEAGCFDAERNLICGSADYTVHTHDALCYDDSGNLVCTMKELQEHIHEESCYEQVTIYHCGKEAGEGGHAHDDSCYGPQEQICTLEETAGHTHGDGCYAQPRLTCAIPEAAAHHHGDGCYAAPELLCQSAEHIHGEGCYGQPELLCQDAEHAHEAGCYGQPQLLCQSAEHTHGEGCYGQPEQICGLSETEGHTHAEGCYAVPERICQQPEVPGHSHGSECYKERELTCQQQESPGHVHTEECGSEVVEKLLCDKKEVRLHKHTETCYEVRIENEEEITVRICNELEVLEHQHDESCLVDHVHSESCYNMEQEEPVLTCPYHVHTDECYDEEQTLICGDPMLICGMEEHCHTESCYPEEPDGMVDITFEIPEEYAAFVQSESTFPLVLTLEEGTIPDEAQLPAVAVVNPEGEQPVYLEVYHWLTPEGYVADWQMPFEQDAVLQLKLYPAEQPEQAKAVTARFLVDEEVMLTRTVTAGTQVTDLIDTQLQQVLEQRSGAELRFEGWAYTTSDGSAVLVEPGITAITEDTDYRAVFREYIGITLHDIDPEGADYPESPRLLYLPRGSTLAEQTEQKLYDGTPITEVPWYTEAGEEFSPDTPIEGEQTLYTYSYTLTLNLDREAFAEEARQKEEQQEAPVSILPFLAIKARAADVEPQQNEVTEIPIVKRAGSTLTETDFVVDGVNYSQLEWEDTDGNPVDTQDLMGSTMSQSFALVRAATEEYQIVYNININNTVFGTTPTVGDGATVTDTYSTDNGTYTVRVPSDTQYMVDAGSWFRLYEFTGWAINNTNNTINPGEIVNAQWFVENEKNKVVTLTAQWDDLDHAETVHFYVNLNCQVTDVDGNYDMPDQNDFTDSVFSTSMSVTGSAMRNSWSGPYVGNFLYKQQVVVRADAVEDTAITDQRIRQMAGGGYDTTNLNVWKSNYTGEKVFMMDSFPSNEHVLSMLREMVRNGSETIKMNNVILTEDDLRPEKIAVRWNVVKYDRTNGWHVDGVLVGRQANMTVTKTFLGDDTAIEQVKNGDYYIEVVNAANANKVTKLVLQSNQVQTGNNPKGYDAYDEATDTYTWHIPLELDNQYHVREKNYKNTAEDVKTIASYTISNSDDAFAGWVDYPENGVTNVKAYSYPSDISLAAYQTVALRNAYVKSDTLVINKTDLATGTGLGGIPYRLRDSQGNDLTLYHRSDTNVYSLDPQDLDNGFVKLDESVITTGSNGSIFLKLDNGIFTLEEAFPMGYGGHSRIQVEVGLDEAGDSVVFREVTCSDSTIQTEQILVDRHTATLNIRNISYPTSVTVEKDWGQESDPLPVTVVLYRNGAAMTGGYQVVLNSDNNWTHTWNDLPLFADGEPAEYTIREIKIGDTNYDDQADKDGYEDYNVIYDALSYFKDGNSVDGPAWKDTSGVTQYADSAKLVVHNRVHRGEMVFQKVDQNEKPLAGAVFRLYSDKAQTQQIAEATSDEFGQVIFYNLMPDTYYVMKETDTPVGYIGGDSLYEIRLNTQGNTAIKDANTGDTVEKIVNVLDQVEVDLLKISRFGTALAGAQFQLERQLENGNWEQVEFSEAEGESIRTLITDELGHLSFGRLGSGTYQLIETQAPDGFHRLESPIVFSIEHGIMTLENTQSAWSLQKNIQTGIYTLTVVNDTGYVLPRTGGITAHAYTGTGMILVLAALALLVWKRRRGDLQF